MSALSNAGQMAAIIMSSGRVDDEPRAILALLDAGWRCAEIMADLDAAMALARVWSEPMARAA